MPTTSTMDTSIAGKGKGVENAGANPVASRSAEEMVIFLCVNPAMDSVQDLKMLARDKMLQGGGRFGQGRVVGQDGTNRGYGQAMGLMYGGCGRVGVGWGSVGCRQVNIVMVVMPLTPSPRVCVLQNFWRGQRKKGS